MVKRVGSVLALITLAIALAACATAAPKAATEDVGAGRPTAFEAWAVGNGTGAFFRALGPAGGAGVRHSWPE
jgi:hypothetical protein